MIPQMPWNRIKFLMRKNQVLEENYHLLSDLYQKNEQLYHDMNHHLQMIYHLAKHADAPEILHYVSSISTPVSQLSGVIWSGTDIVDAILNHAMAEAESHGILMDINVEFPKNCPIASDDLCVILFNLLDNAMESCMKCRGTLDSVPLVSVTIRRIHQFLIIKIQNPYLQPPRRRFGLFASTKSNPLHHGIGLRNVKETVEKYNGNLEFEVRDGQFVTTALLFYNDSASS